MQIYFDTATYDEVERDKKIKTEAQLSLIGGTMGLLTGFSIISGVEIIFFLFRLISQIEKVLKIQIFKCTQIIFFLLRLVSSLRITRILWLKIKEKVGIV